MTVITLSGLSTANINSSSLDALFNHIPKEFSLDTQLTKVQQSCFTQLRLLSKIGPFLSPADFEKVIHAFTTFWLDYCNALYSDISKRNIHRLQLIVLLPGFEQALRELHILHQILLPFTG